MIFVTVGTTYFDQLVMAVDKLASKGVLKDSIVMQIGSGKYVPENTEYFRYADSLEAYYREADIVVTHAAAGTLFTLLNMGKKVVAVTNPRLKLYTTQDRRLVHGKKRVMKLTHRQQGLPLKLEEEGYILWAPEVDALGDVLQEAESFIPVKYVKPQCQMAQYIEGLLAQ